MLDKLEYKTVESFYRMFLVISAILISECVIRWWINAEDLLDDDIQVILYMRLLPCLYLPIIGIWCLHRNYSIGYMILGVLIVYLLSQLRLILVFGHCDIHSWYFVEYNMYLLNNLF